MTADVMLRADVPEPITARGVARLHTGIALTSLDRWIRRGFSGYCDSAHA